MKDFSYLLNRKIDDIWSIDEIRKRLYSTFFHKTYYGGNSMIDVNMILDTIDTYFIENNGYIDNCIMVVDPVTEYIYGFILAGSNSIFDNQEVQSDFEKRFSNLIGISIIGYGIDDRVMNQFWIEEMIELLCLFLECQRDDESFDYVWFDCPIDKIDFYKNKYEMLSMENRPNLLYKLLDT